MKEEIKMNRQQVKSRIIGALILGEMSYREVEEILKEVKDVMAERSYHISIKKEGA